MKSSPRRLFLRAIVAAVKEAELGFATYDYVLSFAAFKNVVQIAANLHSGYQDRQIVIVCSKIAPLAFFRDGNMSRT